MTLGASDEGFEIFGSGALGVRRTAPDKSGAHSHTQVMTFQEATDGGLPIPGNYEKVPNPFPPRTLVS